MHVLLNRMLLVLCSPGRPRGHSTCGRLLRDPDDPLALSTPVPSHLTQALVLDSLVQRITLNQSTSILIVLANWLNIVVAR